MPFDFSSNPLCWTSREGGTIAKYPRRERDNSGREYVSWFDLSHHRRFELGAVLQDTEECFAFVDELGREFQVRPLDLRAYAQDVRPILPGARSFGSTDELAAFFLGHGPYGCEATPCRFCDVPTSAALDWVADQDPDLEVDVRSALGCRFRPNLDARSG